MAMTEGPNDYTAKVVRVNPMPAPSSQRVLIEMRGRWKKHEPMSGKDFQPLISNRIAVDPNVDDPGRYRVAFVIRRSSQIAIDTSA